MANNIKSTELICTSRSWDGAWLPDFPAGRPELKVIRMEFPVGAVTGWHHHPVINYGLVEQGDLTIVCTDGTERTFHQGEPLVEVVGTVHRGENRGSVPVILDMFYFSEPGKEVTIQHPEKEIINHFVIPNEVADPQPLKIGFINDSFIIRAKHPGEKSYFLQRINHHIFQNVEGLQQNIWKVTNHIRKKLEAAGETDIDRKVLELVPAKDGKLYYKTPEGDYWRVYVLIENTTSQEKVTPESAYLTGEAFGRFQSQLADLPFDELCESIPNFHNIEFRLHQLDEALAADPKGRKAACKDIIEAIDRRRDEMCLAERLFREGKLPKRINHCDTKVNNILFDEAGKPMCIVDLDTVMPGFVLSDFGDFMRTAANTGLEDDPNLDNIHVDLKIFEAYARGYIKEATFLTDLEKSLLPYGCRLLSYMQTVRFFTDWLNGDTYYKIQYPEHNLVRTRAQLRLVEEQEKVAAQMAEIIKGI